MERFAKIVCTLGPSVNTKEKLQSLINAGMNVARLNFSHGVHQDHEKLIR
jgi:pyruvate kinase